jgi:ribosomal protein S27E
MSIELKKVIKNGDKRYLRFKCPECTNPCLTSVTFGENNEKEVQCPECNAIFVIAWDESDETLH